jgi:transcriptional regulator GlxA family with amidase domain
MQRRQFIKSSSVTALLAAGLVNVGNSKTQRPQSLNGNKLTPPQNAPIPVAFALSERATIIDFCGPWEVFQDVNTGSNGGFDLFTVAETTDMIHATAGMKIVPDYTFETAPIPKIVVIPAQTGSAALHKYLRRVLDQTDVTMSVCTGAFQLARAGLLDGKEATTHHDFFDRFEQQFPNVKLKRGLRFVEGPKISTAGGLTSGIDLALRVVERYFGRKVAEQTAIYMEYQSKAWMVD